MAITLVYVAPWDCGIKKVFLDSIPMAKANSTADLSGDMVKPVRVESRKRVNSSLILWRWAESMLKVFIDGKHFQDQMGQCENKEGQIFHLKLVKIDHDRLGKWDIYFESLPAQSLKNAQ